MRQGPLKLLDQRVLLLLDQKAPHGFDREEKISCKSLPGVLEREEAGDGVCCSWLVRAGLGEHPLSMADKAQHVQGEKPAGVAGRGISARSSSEVSSGLC